MSEFPGDALYVVIYLMKRSVDLMYLSTSNVVSVLWRRSFRLNFFMFFFFLSDFLIIWLVVCHIFYRLQDNGKLFLQRNYTV